MDARRAAWRCVCGAGRLTTNSREKLCRGGIYPKQGLVNSAEFTSGDFFESEIEYEEPSEAFAILHP